MLSRKYQYFAECTHDAYEEDMAISFTKIIQENGKSEFKNMQF